MTIAFPLAWPEGWKRKASWQRKSASRFNTTFAQARGELLNELRLLGAKSVVISSNMAVRNDGLPYAETARRKIEDPGVAVYFARGDRRLVMARDVFTTVHDNLRSIGLAIAALRTMERHGGGDLMDRAFDGFAALPPPSSSPPAGTWRDVLGPIPPHLSAATTLELVEQRFRDKARQHHPDRGGDVGAMTLLNLAIVEARRELQR
jgi:hypothetical protein